MKEATSKGSRGTLPELHEGVVAYGNSHLVFVLAGTCIYIGGRLQEGAEHGLAPDVRCMVPVWGAGANVGKNEASVPCCKMLMLVCNCQAQGLSFVGNACPGLKQPPVSLVVAWSFGGMERPLRAVQHVPEV